MTKQLTYGTPIRAASWYDCTFATTFTLAGYAAKDGRDLAPMLEQATRLGHEIVGSIYTGSALLGDRAEAQRQLDIAREIVRGAVTLATGDVVEIDGVPHTVSFARGNEFGKTPINSDPIKFTLIAAPAEA